MSLFHHHLMADPVTYIIKMVDMEFLNIISNSHMIDGRFFISGGNNVIKNTTHLAEAERLFLEWDSVMHHAPVHLGHIYLVRITGREGKDFELIAKMLVIGHRPGESVTFRWDIIKYSP